MLCLSAQLGHGSLSSAWKHAFLFSKREFPHCPPHLPLKMGLALSHTVRIPATPHLSLASQELAPQQSIALAHEVPVPRMPFLPRAAWPPYSSFKAQVKCHLSCDAFHCCSTLTPIPPCSRGTWFTPLVGYSLYRAVIVGYVFAAAINKMVTSWRIRLSFMPLCVSLCS